MAAPKPEELEQIKKLLSDISDIYKKLGKDNKWSKFDIRGITDAKAAIGQLEDGLAGAKDKLEALTDGAQELFGAFKGIVNEIKNSNSAVTDSVKGYSRLGRLAQDLRNDQKGIYELSKKELQSIQSKLQSEVQNIRLANEIAKRREEELMLKVLSNKATEKETKELQQLGDTINTNNSFLKESGGLLESMNKTIEERLKLEKKIEKQLGLSGATIGILKKYLPGPLADALKLDDAMAAMRKAAKEGKSKFAIMGEGIKEIGKGIGQSLTDPLVVVGLLVKGFKLLLEIGFKVDKQVTALSRSLAISKGEAEMMRDRFIEIQNSQQSIYETTENLVNAQLELGKAFGATRGFTEQQLKDQVLLTKQMGLEEEATAGLQQLALANGITADDILASTIKQTASLARQTGIQLDNKKVLNEVAKVSGQLRLQYKNNPELIAKAVVQTEKLGISLGKAKDMANSLLQFEDSISAELEAELLTGKQINLEQARLLALNGKTAEAAAEISKEIGSSAEYSAMNVLQQDAYAKALGMSADELADMLLYNENINNLGDSTKSQIEEQIRLAKKKGDTEKVQMLERSIGNEKEAIDALKSIDAQEKFNQAVEKLKSMLSDLVAGPAMDLANGLANMLSNTDNIKQAFGGISKIIGGISLAKMIGQTLTLAGAQAIAAAGAITWASGITLGAGILAVMAGIAMAKSGYNDIANSMESKAKSTPIPVSDAQISPDGGLVVSGRKGTYQLDKEDTVIAGTGLSKSVQDATISPDGELISSDKKGTYQSDDNKKEKETKIIAKGGETTLTIDGRAFARLMAPYIIAETSLIGMTIGQLQ